MFTKSVVMTPASEIGPDESTLPFQPRREGGTLPGAEQRDSRVLLRIPDCTSRLTPARRARPAWLPRWQGLSELGGPWLELVRPVLPPRLLAAGAIGVLLGVVLIVLTPDNKRLPSIHTHTDQAATGQRDTSALKTAEESNGPRANLGATSHSDARPAPAVQANSPATIDAASTPKYEEASRPAGPAAQRAALTGALQ